jgi:hypothetical protein
MAQTTRSSSRSSSSGSSRTKRSTSRNGSSGSSRSARSSSGRTRSNSGSSASSRSRRSTTSASRRTSSAAGARQKSPNGPIAKTGGKVVELASKAKAPLLAGGAALAGVAGGVALKSRNQNRRPLKRLSSVSLPKSVKNVDLGKVDLDSLTSVARQVQSIGEQVGDVVDAAEKTRKKHK